MRRQINKHPAESIHYRCNLCSDNITVSFLRDFIFLFFLHLILLNYFFHLDKLIFINIGLNFSIIHEKRINLIHHQTKIKDEIIDINVFFRYDRLIPIYWCAWNWTHLYHINRLNCICMKKCNSLTIHVQPLIPDILPTIIMNKHLILSNINDLGLQPLPYRILNINPLTNLNFSIFIIERSYIIINVLKFYRSQLIQLYSRIQ